MAALVAAAMVVAAMTDGCAPQAASSQVTIAGRTWRVELAVTERQHRAGLSGRTTLAADEGMLFVFPDSAVRFFWMQDCRIPLDVAFIDERRRVVCIHTMPVEPGLIGATSYSSRRPAKYALEVPAGALSAAGAKVGDEATFRGNIPQ